MKKERPFNLDLLKQPTKAKLQYFRDVIVYCLQHNCQLCDRCPHCDSTQKAIANNSRLGFCDKCKQWLGNERNDEVEIVDKERQIITGIGELIAVEDCDRTASRQTYKFG